MPHGKVVNSINDTTMPPSQMRVTCHKVDTQFHKCTNGDNGMQWRRWSMEFAIVYLERMKLLEHKDTIMENGGQKIINM